MGNSISSPFVTITVSAATYSAIFKIFSERDRSQQTLRTLIKAISAGHATIATCLTLVSLYQPWGNQVFETRMTNLPNPNQQLDDSQNPLIQDRNALASFVTAWEAGYLIYDTGSLVYEAYIRNRAGGFWKAIVRVLQSSPVMLIHHTALAATLVWLQTYVVASREKGMKILMAFALMNASTPLLHLRWWRKKKTGHQDFRIDTALAVVFAASRFGSVYWVMSKYGQYHDLGPWQAFRMQRLPCQAGTGALTLLNALWWLGLLRQIVRRSKSSA